MAHTKPNSVPFWAAIVSNTGNETNVTDRLMEKSLGAMTEAFEEDLTEFVFSDLKVTLDDEDGAMSSLLMGLAPGCKYRFELWRGTGGTWTLIFAGLIDPTWNMVRDRVEKTVSFTAYSFGKFLEVTSASGVKRNVTGVTATCTAGTVTMTVSSATNLMPDDEITLNDGVKKETNTIRAISGTTCTMTNEWSNTFSSSPVANLTVETPYYRYKTKDFLAGEIFKAAGITSYTVDIDSILSDNPFPVQMNDSGLARVGVRTVTERANTISVWEDAQAYRANSPTVGFSSTSDGDSISDWTPYVASYGSEPTNRKVIARVDDGAYVSGTTAYYYRPRYDFTDNLNNRTYRLYLRRDDATEVLVDSLVVNLDLYESGEIICDGLEYDPTADRILVTYSKYRINAPEEDPITIGRGCKAYSQACVYDTTRPYRGKLRCMRVSSQMVQVDDGVIQIRKLGSPYDTDLVLDPYANLKVWTFRKCGSYIHALASGSEGWTLVTWSATTGAIVQTDLVTSQVGGNGFLSVWRDDTNSKDVVVGYAGPADGVYFYLTNESTDEIPYADFSSTSCARALSDIATSSNAVVVVRPNDQGDGTYQVRGYMVGRKKFKSGFGTTARSLAADYFRWESKPIWELYRKAVVVSGSELRSGEDFEAGVGDLGDTANRLELDGKYVYSSGLAKALAQNYLDFCNVTTNRTQEEVTIPAPTSGGPVRVMERVTFNGTTYRVLSVETDPVTGDQALTMIRED